MSRTLGVGVALVVGTLGLAGSSPAEEPSGQAGFVHVVVFQLKPDAGEKDIDAFIAGAHGVVEKLPVVRALWAGRPAVQATPKFAGKDYVAAVTALLDDGDALQQYLKSPRFQKFKAENDQHMKFTAFDFVDEKPAAAPSSARASYAHVVLFTLAKDAPDDATAGLIDDARGLLTKIPTVRGVRAGKPAARGTPTARKDYQVGLLVLFDNYDGLKTYLDHPLHTQYVEKHGKHIDLEKLRVYDFVNQKK